MSTAVISSSAIAAGCCHDKQARAIASLTRCVRRGLRQDALRSRVERNGIVNLEIWPSTYFAFLLAAVQLCPMNFFIEWSLCYL